MKLLFHSIYRTNFLFENKLEKGSQWPTVQFRAFDGRGRWHADDKRRFE